MGNLLLQMLELDEQVWFGERRFNRERSSAAGPIPILDDRARPGSSIVRYGAHVGNIFDRPARSMGRPYRCLRRGAQMVDAFRFNLFDCFFESQLSRPISDSVRLGITLLSCSSIAVGARS